MVKNINEISADAIAYNIASASKIKITTPKLTNILYADTEEIYKQNFLIRFFFGKSWSEMYIKPGQKYWFMGWHDCIKDNKIDKEHRSIVHFKEDHNYWPIPIEAESNEIFEKYENDDKYLISKEPKTDENGIEYYEIFRKASLTFYLPDDILIQYFNTEIEALEKLKEYTEKIPSLDKDFLIFNDENDKMYVYERNNR